MSERGLLLALQRLHDDPGFATLVKSDPQDTLGIYDLDDNERQSISQAVANGDNDTLKQMATQVGINWTADHISGAGAIDDADDDARSLYVHGDDRPGALPGDGYEGVQPTRPG